MDRTATTLTDDDHIASVAPNTVTMPAPASICDIGRDDRARPSDAPGEVQVADGSPESIAAQTELEASYAVARQHLMNTRWVGAVHDAFTASRYRARGLRREAAINDKVALLEAISGLNRLVNAERLDVEAALSFLNTLPYPLDTEIGATIEHARTCVAAVPGGDHKHEAVACYAIKRIALVLERRLKDG